MCMKKVNFHFGKVHFDFMFQSTDIDCMASDSLFPTPAVCRGKTCMLRFNNKPCENVMKYR